MKFVSLLLLSSSLVSSQFIVTEKEPSLKEIISNNIDIFNLPEENGKVRTYFNEVSSSLDVYDKNKNKFGEIIIFDNNEGYLFYSLNNEIIKESYDEGIPFSYQELKGKVIYSNNCYMDMSYNVIYDLSISQNYAGGLNEKFHSHVDESFTKEKNRIMLTEWDSKYYTKVDIESWKQQEVAQSVEMPQQQLLEEQEQLELLHRAIDRLPENQRTALILNKYEELSYKEIAEVMGVTLSSVESLLFRAKNNLEKIFNTK